MQAAAFFLIAGTLFAGTIGAPFDISGVILRTKDEGFLCNIEGDILARQTIDPLDIEDCSFLLKHNGDLSYSLRAANTGLYLSWEDTKIRAVDQTVGESGEFMVKVDGDYITFETPIGFWMLQEFDGQDYILTVGESDTVPSAKFEVKGILTQFGRYEPVNV